jgi:hypothetical protein
MSLRVAPVAASSGFADGKSSGYPDSYLPRLLRLMDLRVSPNLAPSGGSVYASSGCPDSCIYGWVDDDSPAILELCILGRAVDESSCPTGYCTFPPDPGCILNLNSAFDRRQAGCELPISFAPCIVLTGWNCVSNSLQGHQLEWRLG